MENKFCVFFFKQGIRLEESLATTKLACRLQVLLQDLTSLMEVKDTSNPGRQDECSF